MPIRTIDFFADPTTGLNPEVNHFVARMKAGAGEGSLPCLYGPMLKDAQYRWLETFQKRNHAAVSDLILEVGMHKGDTMAQMASDRPDLGFIGLDITFKRVVTTAEKAKTDGRPNMLACLANAHDLQQLFLPNSLRGAVIFFPDPWDKKKGQTKKRLVQLAFLRKIHDAVKPGGFLWFKTDSFDYANAVADANHSIGWSLTDRTFPDAFSTDYGSVFERKFQTLGLQTANQVWVKIAAPSAPFQEASHLIN